MQETNETQVGSTVTIEQMDQLMCDLFAQRAVCDAAKEALAIENNKLAALKSRATGYLRDLGRDSYKSEHGTVGFSDEKWSVTMPKTDLEKTAFFDWLRSQGMFDKYATVNSASLNALYNEQKAIADREGRGMEFSIPGIGLAKVFQDLSMRKAK